MLNILERIGSADSYLQDLRRNDSGSSEERRTFSKSCKAETASECSQSSDKESMRRMLSLIPG